ncbi:MAG: InlB B-repeat-containing protein, partial [Clostridia bacterium]|nr:InlB B-repeat-containing protein [Clostridia bacterium]
MYKTFRKSIALLLTMLMIFNVSAIAAGTTDGVGVKLYWSDDISSSVWNDAENADTNAIFAVDGFEAGSEAVRYLKVQSTGSLAYSYVLDAVYGGADASLAEAIDVYVKEGVTANVAISDMTKMGTLADVFSGAKLSEGKISPASEAATDGYYYTENIIAVALKMPETVGAEYMNKILDSFDITLSATECDFEYARGEFSVKFPNTDKYLYRVGNQNPVAVGSLFEGANVVGDVNVTVTPLDAEYPASGTYTANSSDWTKGTIQFGGTGIVEVTITDSSASTQPVSLKLEVVDAKNATTHTSATANNVVLLNDISGGFSISNGYAVYGNGFTITCSGNGSYKERTGLKIGFISIETGGILDGARVICDVFPISALYRDDLTVCDKDNNGVDRYRYQLSAISISGDSTISNCYIYGARNNVFVGGGNVTIKDTILESGSLSNVHIKSDSNYNVTLDNLTTVQYPTKSNYDTEKTVMGFGVLVGDNDSSSNAAITLKGDLKQYNWVYSGMGLSNTYANYAINGALDKSEYHYTINDKTSVNMGIAYLNALPQTIVDERSNKEQIPYLLKSVSILTETGHVYSAKSGSELAASRFDPEADGIIPCEIRENGLYSPQFKLKADLGGQKIDNIEGCDEYCYKENNGVKVMFVSGDYMELDLNAMVDIQKYTNQNLNLSITCKDSAGNAIGLSGGKLMLSQKMDYTVTYTVTDNVFYDKDGQKIDNSVNWTWDVPVSVTLKDKSIPDARFEFDSANQKIYRSGNSNIVQFIPPLAGLKIYDYVGQEEYLRFDGDNDFAKIAKASIDNVSTSTQGPGCHIVTIEFVDGGKLIIDMDIKANSGSSTYTGSIKVRNNVLYVVNGGTTSGKGQTWKIYSYKFIGNNGVEINSGAITFGTAGVDCDTATKPSSNFSTTVSATVTYDANGGTCGQTVGYKTSNYPTLTLPTPVRSGYIFSGWYTEANGGTKVGGAGDSYSPSANIALYARWGVASKITYDANGGLCDKESEVFNGDALILPTPVLDGYWFKGWYTEPNGGTKVGDAGTTYVPTATATLYAQWSKIYTVNFDANGGSVSMSSTSYAGTSITLPLPSYSG